MDIFSIFFNMNVCYVFSLESPRRGDCNEYTRHTIYHFQYKKEKSPKLSQVCSYGIFFKRFQNEFEIATLCLA